MAPKSSRRPSSKIPSRGELKEFSTAHQNVLLERMEKQFHVFGEGQVLLTEKVDRLEEILLLVVKRLDSLESRVAALETKWDMVFKDASSILNYEERMRQLEERIVALEAHSA